MQNKDRTLMLAGTLALSKRTGSPLSKLKETRGIISVKRVPDCFEVKNALVQKELPKTEYEFKNLQPHEFKNYDTLLFNQKDFQLRTKPEPIDNPHNLSVFEKKLKATFDREQAKIARETEAKLLDGKQNWCRSFPLPEPYQPISKDIQTKNKEQTQFLEKEKWEPVYLLLARTIEDNLVVGKPDFNSYVKPIKVEDKNKAFDGTHAPLKVLN